MSDEKVLTREIAEKFLADGCMINQYQIIDSPETARLLATAKRDLDLEGVTKLDPDIAAELIQHRDVKLDLRSLLDDSTGKLPDYLKPFLQHPQMKYAMFGGTESPRFSASCGNCLCQVTEYSWDIAAGTAYSCHHVQLEESGWSINASDSWITDPVIRCPDCTIKEKCPKCGDAVLIAVPTDEECVCMECDTETLAGILGFESPFND